MQTRTAAPSQRCNVPRVFLPKTSKSLVWDLCLGSLTSTSPLRFLFSFPLSSFPLAVISRASPRSGFLGRGCTAPWRPTRAGRSRTSPLATRPPRAIRASRRPRAGTPSPAGAARSGKASSRSSARTLGSNSTTRPMTLRMTHPMTRPSCTLSTTGTFRNLDLPLLGL